MLLATSQISSREISQELLNDVTNYNNATVATAIFVGWERSNYTVFETSDGDFCVLLCVTVEDVRFSFTLDTNTVDGTATGMIS